MYAPSFHSQKQGKSKTEERNLSRKQPPEASQITVSDTAGKFLLCLHTHRPSHLIHTTAWDAGTVLLAALQTNTLIFREVESFIQAHTDSAENQNFNMGLSDFRTYPLNCCSITLTRLQTGQESLLAVRMRTRAHPTLQPPHPCQLWQFHRDPPRSVPETGGGAQ